MVLTQVRLGNSGLKISPILVGCMSYGSKDWADWVLEDKEKIFEILKFCYDNGLRTFDTADAYSNGLSERLLGEFLKHYNIKRETVVILTKFFLPVDESLDLTHAPKPLSETEICDLENQRGLSRKHIIAGVENSCERLGTYIDVLQVHRINADDEPVEEMMRALNDVVTSGKVRYIGASTMRATQFVELQAIAEIRGWHKFISMQSCYNLLYREDEREIIPYAKRHNIGLIPWSPNARGILCRPAAEKSSARYNSDPTLKRRNLNNLEPQDIEIVDRVEKLAHKYNVPMTVISSSWILSKNAYPIVGLSSIERVKEIIQAVEFTLSDDDIAYLEEPYLPKPMIL